MGFPRPLPIAWISGILVASLLALTCLNLPSPAAKPKLCLGSTRRYHDDLLADPQFQAALPFKTGANQVDWAPDFHNPSSAMGYLGFGKRSTKNINFAGLSNILAASSLLYIEHAGAIDARRTSAIYLHSSSLTNFRVLGPAGSRSILAKIPVNQLHGCVLAHQHSGHILDFIPCGV